LPQFLKNLKGKLSRALTSSEDLAELAELAGVLLADGNLVFSSSGCRIWRLRLNAPFDTFIVDSEWGVDLAAKPEIVGEDFLRCNLEAAKGVAAFLKEEVLEKDLPVVFLHVLRASKGYMLHEALRALGVELVEAWIRPRYIVSGYGDHSTGGVEVRAKDFSPLERAAVSGEVALVVADTVASGKTLARCLCEALNELKARGLHLAQLVVYGFISLEGLARINPVAKKTCVVAIEDYTALASNGYDMPLYGVDRALYERTGELRSLGGITVPEAFEGLVIEYAPGMDQPGDWSERQHVLLSENGFEAGNIRLHLERSLEALRSLKELTRKAPWYKVWMENIFAAREAALQARLATFSAV
jgi:uracil phosphoribosyltransferase